MMSHSHPNTFRVCAHNPPHTFSTSAQRANNFGVTFAAQVVFDVCAHTIIMIKFCPPPSAQVAKTFGPGQATFFHRSCSNLLLSRFVIPTGPAGAAWLWTGMRSNYLSLRFIRSTEMGRLRSAIGRRKDVLESTSVCCMRVGADRKFN